MKLLIHRNAYNLIHSCLVAIFTLAVLLASAEPVVASATLRQAQGPPLRQAQGPPLRVAPVAVPRQARGNQLVEAPVVQVSPSALDVTVGGSGTVSLEVLGGVEINAYDVTIRYDPAVIDFVSWSHGGFLSHLAQVYKVDEPGKLRLVFTQLATPPVSGDGILLNLVFRGVAVGTSDVLIEALDFAGSDGTISNPPLISGTIFVITAQPTAEPTITLLPPTATHTLLPATNTPVATATRGVTALATPNLQRTSPVQGSPTPIRQLTSVTDTAPPLVAEKGAAPVGEIVEPPVTTPQQAGFPEPVEAPTNPTSNRLLNLALWAVLGIFFVAIVWMALVAIRRSKTQSSDKE